MAGTMNCFGMSTVATIPHVDRREIDTVFQLCRTDQWSKVLVVVQEKPWIALNPIIMDNHISTTILHQAITSKGNTALRAKVIQLILKVTPQAARIKNGYGSLPLHVIAQRNTKIDAQTKEKLIFELIQAYKGALREEGGVGKRTPLHIIFTDYISPQLTKIMIANGQEACFMKDKKGYLPAHVACSRHCSPEKLRMLLDVNPASLFDQTHEGHTLLSLATSTATKSHPNYALIDELNRQIQMRQTPTLPRTLESSMVISEESDTSRERLDSNDSDRTFHSDMFGFSYTTPQRQPFVSAEPRKMQSRKRPYPDSRSAATTVPLQQHSSAVAGLDPVDLLLHFSRNGSPQSRHEHSTTPNISPPSQYAEV